MSAEQPTDVDDVEDLRIAPEIEWPMADGPEATFTKRGLDSSPVKSRLNNEFIDDMDVSGWRTRIGADSTIGDYGAELSPRDPIHGRDIVDWYQETIRLVEDVTGHGYEPTGLMEERFATAGLHLHLSPLPFELAEELWEMSQEPWLQAFTGSSITEDNIRVFRGGQYVNLHDQSGNYAAMRPRDTRFSDRREAVHWEWRVPEPMTPEHFGHLIEFLDIWLHDGRAEAREHAMNLLTQDDSPLTAIRRAEAVGIQGEFQQQLQVTMDRTPHPATERFYDTVRSMDGVPYTFRATTPQGEYYYFHSFEDTSLSATVENYDITVEHGTVLDATSLNRVSDEALAEEMEAALEDISGTNNPFEQPSGDGEQVRSEVTDFLLETAFEE